MREKPIIHFLREHLPLYFPVLTTPGHGLHRTGIGGYANRGDYHPTGRAADIYLNVSNNHELRIGDALFRLFYQQAGRLGVDHVIWNRRIWSASRGGPRPYTGASPHTNHIHVYFTVTGASQRPDWLLDHLDTIAVDLGEVVRA